MCPVRSLQGFVNIICHIPILVGFFSHLYSLLPDSTSQLKVEYHYSSKAQVFPCESCEVFEKIYFEEHLRTTVSVWARFVPVVR